MPSAGRGAACGATSIFPGFVAIYSGGRLCTRLRDGKRACAIIFAKDAPCREISGSAACRGPVHCQQCRVRCARPRWAQQIWRAPAVTQLWRGRPQVLGTAAASSTRNRNQMSTGGPRTLRNVGRFRCCNAPERSERAQAEAKGISVGKEPCLSPATLISDQRKRKPPAVACRRSIRSSSEDEDQKLR